MLRWFHWAIFALPVAAAGLLSAGVIPAAAVGAVGIASTVAGILAHSPLVKPPVQ